MKNYFKLIVSILCLLGAGSVFPNTASALSLSPVRFELSGDPGQIIEEEFSVINETEATETFYFSFVNFEAQGESGTPSFVDAKEGLATWIKTETNSIGIGPKEQKKVPFKIQIPKNAEAGGHFGVIFLGNSPKGEGNSVSVGSQTGILVLLSVNGIVREEAGLFDYGIKNGKFFHKTLPVNLIYRFKNDGNDRIKPQGKITVRNMLFLPTEKLNANPIEGNVLPGSTRKFEIPWIEYERPLNYLPKESFMGRFWDEVVYEWKNFAFGFYIANLKVNYGVQNIAKVSDTTFFFVFPWELSIIMLIVLLVLYFGGRTLIRKYNRYIISKARANI